MPYKDKVKQREYQRKWKAKRRAEFFEGKCCEECGGAENLELHHEDRSKKESHKIWSWSKERREAELAKCVVLCRDCHWQETYKQLGYGK